MSGTTESDKYKAQVYDAALNATVGEPHSTAGLGRTPICDKGHYHIYVDRAGERHYYSYMYVPEAAMTTLKLTAVGTSTGVIIPKEMLTRLNVAKGDALYAVETPDGGYRLTPYDPDFAGKMAKADEIMRRYRNTLHALAK